MLISVIIPLYNKEKYISETILTVLNQTFQNFEIIIINDGSTDKSIDIINSIGDSRIKLINIINSGVSNARNIGILNSKGDWIAFLDADDTWSFNYLEELVGIVNNNKDIFVVATNYYRKYSNNLEKLAFNSIPNGYVESYFNASCITSSSVLIHKSVFENIGLFDTRIKYGEDQHMWLRINMIYKTYFNSKPLVMYRMNDHTSSIFNFENKDIKHDLVYYINAIKSNDIKWEIYKSHYLFKYLKPYYVCDNHINDVKNLLNTANKKYSSFLEIIFYSLPRFIVKPFYKKFYKYKYTKGQVETV